MNSLYKVFVPVLIAATSLANASEVELAVESVNQGGLNVYGGVRQHEGNRLYSPYSSAGPLAIAAFGARGTTQEQMIEALALPPDLDGYLHQFGTLDKRLNVNDEDVIEKIWGDFVKIVKDSVGEKEERYKLALHTANRLWTDETFVLEERFRTRVAKYFDAPFAELDFMGQPDASRKEINKWVEKATRDRIKDLLDPSAVTSDTRVVITSALYMKGQWQTPFDPGMTRPDSWTKLDGSTVTADFMAREAAYRQLAGDGFRAIELPYQKANDESNVELAMRIYLPDEESGLYALEQRMIEGAELLESDEDDWNYREVQLLMPRWKFEDQHELAPYLIAHGMQQAFQPSADFTGMAAERPLYISRVIQKTFIEVDESGTEAAAATAVVMPTRAAVDPIPEFRADHPFLFTIVDKGTGTLLFVGRVAEPSS